MSLDAWAHRNGTDNMGEKTSLGCCGITRRGFLLGAAAGFATGAPLAWLGSRYWHDHAAPRFTGRSHEAARPAGGMPGRFPGRVIEVHHPGAVGPDHRADPDAVRDMV